MPATDTSELTQALMRVSQSVQRAVERCADEYGVSAIQAQMLRLLIGGAPTMNQLAAALGLDKSSASGLVDRAQRRGLVRRVPSQLDRRSVRVRLTNEGRELAHDVSTLLSDELDAMLAPLPPAAREALAHAFAQLLGD